VIPELLYPEVADEADQAAKREDDARAEALQRRRPEGPPAVGACHYCGELIRPGLRWCDEYCRDDWERGQGQ
jgi:hypothetical protein